MATVAATRTQTQSKAARGAKAAAKTETTTAAGTQTPTAMQSLTVMKNVLGATIGSITYLRNLFPDENYRDTKINGLQLKTLVPSLTPEADRLIEWIDRGCCDALQKQYLKTMVFGIYVDESRPDHLVESYSFSFSYPDKDRWAFSLSSDGKQQFAFKTRDDVTRATCEMLRRLLILTQTLEPLPENAFLTMRLYYYDSVTPAQYEPPLFRAGQDTLLEIEGSDPLEVEIGNVASPYHALSLRVQAASGPPDARCAADEVVVVQDQSQEEPRAELAHITSNLGQLDIKTSGVAAVEHNNESMVSPLQSQVDHSSASLAKQVNFVGETQELINALQNGGRIDSVGPEARADANHSTAAAAPEATNSHIESCSASTAALANTQPLSPISNRRFERRGPSMQETPRSEAGDLSMSLIMESSERMTRRRISAMLAPQKGKEVAATVDLDSTPQKVSDSPAYDSTVGMEKHDATQATASTPPATPRVTESQAVVLCPCGINDADTKLIPCSACGVQAHAICLGCYDAPIESQEDSGGLDRESSSVCNPVPTSRMCEDCTTRSGMRSGSAPSQQLALARRSLARVWNQGTVHGIRSLSHLIGSNMNTSRMIMALLTSEGFLREPPVSKDPKLNKCHRARDLIVVKNATTIAKFQSYFPGISVTLAEKTRGKGKHVRATKRSKKSVDDAAYTSDGSEQCASVVSAGAAPSPDLAISTNSTQQTVVVDQTKFMHPNDAVSAAFTSNRHSTSQADHGVSPIEPESRLRSAKKRKVSVVEHDIAAL